MQDLLDESYQDLIEGITNEGFNETTQEISEILQVRQFMSF